MSKQKAPTCCFCCHIKVGTFILAVLFLVGGIIGIVGSSLFLTNTLKQQEFMSKNVISDEDDLLYTPYSRTTLWIALGNGVFITLIASLAMYGLIKNRAGFLLPIFILQLFNLLCTIVYIGSVMFYWQDIRKSIVECSHMSDDWKTWFENLDDRWLALMIFGALFIKSYLIALVYNCYKFMTMQAVLRQQRDPEISFVIDPGNGPIYKAKPPKYDDVQKVPLFDDVESIDTKPPPYAA